MGYLLGLTEGISVKPVAKIGMQLMTEIHSKQLTMVVTAEIAAQLPSGYLRTSYARNAYGAPV